MENDKPKNRSQQTVEAINRNPDEAAVLLRKNYLEDAIAQPKGSEDHAFYQAELKDSLNYQLKAAVTGGTHYSRNSVKALVTAISDKNVLPEVGAEALNFRDNIASAPGTRYLDNIHLSELLAPEPGDRGLEASVGKKAQEISKIFGADGPEMLVGMSRRDPGAKQIVEALPPEDIKSSAQNLMTKVLESKDPSAKMDATANANTFVYGVTANGTDEQKQALVEGISSAVLKQSKMDFETKNGTLKNFNGRPFQTQDAYLDVIAVTNDTRISQINIADRVTEKASREYFDARGGQPGRTAPTASKPSGISPA